MKIKQFLFDRGHTDGDSRVSPPGAFTGLNFLPKKGQPSTIKKVLVANRDHLLPGTNSQDDRIYAVRSVAPRHERMSYPAYQNIESVQYYVNNVWDRSSIAAPRTPAFVKLWHTTKANANARFGMYFHQAVETTATKSLWVTIIIQQFGTYDSTKHKIHAEIWNHNSTTGALSNSIVVCSADYSADLGDSGTVRVTFEFSGAKSFTQGEYAIVITDSSSAGAVSASCYAMGVSASASDPFGFGVIVNNTGITYQAPAEIMVYQRNGAISNGTNQDYYTKSATRAMYAKRNIDPLFLSLSTGASGVSGNTLGTHNVNMLVFSDGFGMYCLSPFLDPNNASASAYYLDYTGFPLNLYDVTNISGLTKGTYYQVDNYKGIGAIEDICQYKNMIVACGNGGIAVFNPASSFYTSYLVLPFAYSEKVAIPNIGGRINTIDSGWVTTGAKNPDVYQPYINSVWVAGINPGRLFACYDDKIIWSGGITAATAGDPTSWNAFATIQFGDSSDFIQKGCFFGGYTFLWTTTGIYYVTGEPPANPTYGYGTLSAQFLKTVGRVDNVQVTSMGVFFTTEGGKQVWFMDASLNPKRIDNKMLSDLLIDSIWWSDDDQQLWVSCSTHTSRQYLATGTSDATLTAVSKSALTYVFDWERQGWYPVRRPLDIDTTSGEPTPVILGKTAWRVGCAYQQAASTITAFTYTFGTGILSALTFSVGTIANIKAGMFIKDANGAYYLITAVGAATITTTAGLTLGIGNLTCSGIVSRLSSQCINDDGFTIHYSAANDAFPENSSNRLTPITATIDTPEVDVFDDVTRAGKAVKASISGRLFAGSTLVVGAKGENGVTANADTIAGDQGFATPVNASYTVQFGDQEPTRTIRLSLSITGANADEIRAAELTYKDSFKAANSS